MSNPYKIGLIGAGRHGRYIAPFTREAGDIILAAAADVSEEALDKAVTDCGFQRAYTHYQEMLAQEALDAVIVATPHHLLYDACLAAINAGKHVFVEKPMALTLAQGQAIVAAANQAGVKLMVGYCLRFNAARTAMKELIERGAVGKITAVMAGKGSAPHTGWLADPHTGGGQLLFLGSHLIDQVLWMVDSPTESVYAEMTLRSDTGADETTAFTLRFADGVRAQLLVSQRVGVGFDYVEIFGTAGRVRAEWPGMVLTVQSSALPAYNNPTTIGVQGESHRPMYVAELCEFIAAIRGQRQPAISGEDGLRTLAVLDAVVASAQAGARVAVTERVGQ